MRFKQFYELYDPFTSNGFEKYYEDLEEIRYQRVFKDKIQRIQLLKSDSIKYYNLSNSFRLKLKPNESVGDWWNKQYDYKSEEELYERYKEMNEYLLALFNQWEIDVDKNQVTASLNKLVFDNYLSINREVIADNNEEIISIKEVRKLIVSLLERYKCVDDFNCFIIQSASLYIAYIISKYKSTVEFNDDGRTIVSLIKENEKNKPIDISWVVSGFWYFGDDDYLERGASGGRIWMGKPVKNPKWKEQNPDYIIE